MSSPAKEEIQCDKETLLAKPGQEWILVIGSNNTFYSRIIEPFVWYRLLNTKSRKNEGLGTAQHPIAKAVIRRDEYHTAKGLNTKLDNHFRYAQVSYLSNAQKQSLTNNITVQKSKKSATTTFSMYEEQHIGSPLQIEISRTPFEGSPSGLKGHQTCFAPSQWNNQTHLMHCSSATQLSKITKMYHTVVTT